MVKGYGLAVMTNSDGGFPLIERICRRIQIAYDWDVLETNGEFRFGPQQDSAASLMRAPSRPIRSRQDGKGC